MTAFRIVTGTLGFVAAIVATPLLLAAMLVFSAADGDQVQLPRIHTSTDARAMTFDADEFDYWGVRVATDPGDGFSVIVEGADLFVGIGPRREVNRLVASEADPATSSIWTASASGDDPTLDVEIPAEPWTAVVMNVDGRPGVDAELLVAVPSGPVRIAAGIVLGAGLMAAILSATLFTVAFRRPRVEIEEEQPEMATV